MAYRNPLAWDRNKRPGLFKSDPNATLPDPLPCIEEELNPLDMELRLQKDYAEIDRMNAEMEALYIQSQLPPLNRR